MTRLLFSLKCLDKMPAHREKNEHGLALKCRFKRRFSGTKSEVTLVIAAAV